MTEHKHPDDGGSYFPEADAANGGSFGGCSLRAEFAKTFAAAWLPIVAAEDKKATVEAISRTANCYGLAMADDLIRRLRESK